MRYFQLFQCFVLIIIVISGCSTETLIIVSKGKLEAPSTNLIYNVDDLVENGLTNSRDTKIASKDFLLDATLNNLIRSEDTTSPSPTLIKISLEGNFQGMRLAYISGEITELAGERTKPLGIIINEGQCNPGWPPQDEVDYNIHANEIVKASEHVYALHKLCIYYIYNKGINPRNEFRLNIGNVCIIDNNCYDANILFKPKIMRLITH